MIDYHRKKGSDAQPFRYTVENYSDGTVPNLTGASVAFVATMFGQSTPKMNGAGTITGTGAAGDPWIFAYAPSSGDVDTVGYYNCEWLITYANGKKERWPCANEDTGVPEYLVLVIVQSLS